MLITPESYTKTEYGIQLNGWAASKDEVRLSATDRKGKTLPVSVAWYPRSDMDAVTDEPSGETMQPRGFRLRITLGEKGEALFPIRIVADGDEKREVNFSARDYRRLSYEGDSGVMPAIYRGWRYFRRFGFKKTYLHFLEKWVPDKGTEEYQRWQKEHFPDKEELLRQAKKQEGFAYRPLVSVVVPLYRTDPEFFIAMRKSVQAQSYPRWELCMADGSREDADGPSPMEEMLQEAADEDERIRYRILKQNKGISENTNQAIAMAKGEWIVFLDHDDTISADALYEIVAACNETPEIDVIYSDQDKVDEGRYFDPTFKEDFSIERLCHRNDLAHLFAVKRELLDQVTEAGEGTLGEGDERVYLRDEFDGAQDYDLIFRCVEKAVCVHHIPKVLYHWREHLGSTAKNPATKRYAYDAGRRAILAYYRRNGIFASVEYGEKDGEYLTLRGNIEMK